VIVIIKMFVKLLFCLLIGFSSGQNFYSPELEGPDDHLENLQHPDEIKYFKPIGH